MGGDMRTKLLQSLREDPWFILPSFHEILEGEVSDCSSQPEVEAGLFEEIMERDPVDAIMSVEDGIASISIAGPLALNVHPLAKFFFGIADFADIRAALDRAALDSNVRGVLLDFDTPGGTVQGTPETAARINALSQIKPVYSFTEGLMASAGYYLASQSTAIYATPSATVGSIGVMLAFHDISERAKEAGIKVEVFRSGKFKGMGYPGTSLSDEQRALLQDRIDADFAEFRDAVLSKRPGISADAMQGQVFGGRAAAAENLLTGLVGDRADAIKRLRSMAGLS